jgi:hypothetical protein
MIKKIKLDFFFAWHINSLFSLVVALHQLMSHLDENFPDAQVLNSTFQNAGSKAMYKRANTIRYYYYF